MAVPKRKRTRSRMRKRYASMGMKKPQTILCPQCGEPALPHRVCPHCGYYKKRKVVEVEEKE